MNRKSIQLYRQLLGSSDDEVNSLWRHQSSSSPNDLPPFPIHNYLPTIDGALAALLTLGACNSPLDRSNRPANHSSHNMRNDVALVVSFFKALSLPEAQWGNLYAVRVNDEVVSKEEAKMATAKVELVLCRGMRNLDWSKALRYRLCGTDQLQPEALQMLAAAHIVPLQWRAISLADRLSYFTYLCEENSLDILSLLLEARELELIVGAGEPSSSELLMVAAESLTKANVFESLLNQTLWGETGKLETSCGSGTEEREESHVQIDEDELETCVVSALANRSSNGAGALIAKVLFRSRKIGHRIQVGELGSETARRWVEVAFRSGLQSTVQFVLDEVKLWGGLDAPLAPNILKSVNGIIEEGNKSLATASTADHQRQKLARRILHSIPAFAPLVRWASVQLLEAVIRKSYNVYSRCNLLPQHPSPLQLNRTGSDSSADGEPNHKEKERTWFEWMTEKLAGSYMSLFQADGGDMVRYLTSLGLFHPQAITSVWWDSVISECIRGTVLRAGAVRAFAAVEGLLRPTVDIVAPLVLSCIVPHQVPAVVRNLQVLEEVLGLDLDAELTNICRLARPTVTYFPGMTLLDVLLAAPLYAFLDLFIFLQSRSKISVHEERGNGQSRFQAARWRGHHDIVDYCENL